LLSTCSDPCGRSFSKRTTSALPRVVTGERPHRIRYILSGKENDPEDRCTRDPADRPPCDAPGLGSHSYCIQVACILCNMPI
jgi:hypothetical protein